MKCMDPVLCYNGTKGRQYRHFSLANRLFKQMHQLVFDCGTCIFCRKKKATELAIRCVLHASLHKQNCFLTLTYDEKKESYHNNFEYSDIQKFKKKLRRYCDYHFKKKIQIFNVHEYGKNGKKHWHLVVFGHDFSEDRKSSPSGYFNSPSLALQWPHGHHSIGSVTEASAMYQAQYTQKDVKYGNISNNKRSHSKHAGIARDYFLTHFDQILRLGYVPFNGRKIPVPRYFQKLAHKHYSHFYEKSNFFDLPYRKRLYTPFKKGSENKKIADLYIVFINLKADHLVQIENEWNQTIEKHLTTKEKPDFIKSAENYLYDLKNKVNKGDF